MKNPNKDNASIKMCGAFCDALKKEGPRDIIIGLGDCNQVTIPAERLKSNKGKTRFSARSKTREKPVYTLTIDCRGWFKLLLRGINLKDCVSNHVTTCVSIKDGPFLCAEEEFKELRYKHGKLKGKLRSLSLSVKEACPK